MNKQELDFNEIFVPLFDNEGNAYTYKLERMFSVGKPEQFYCSAVCESGVDIKFLRCDVKVESGEAELTLFNIEDEDELMRVAEEYQKHSQQAVLEAVNAELSSFDDYITLTDVNGVENAFVVHAIFEDEEAKHSYIAVQKVDDAGDMADEISIYRLREESDKAIIDMIPSDMEYERARSLFMELIEC